MSVRVTAPSRLHFGLLHVPVPGLTHGPDGRPVRRFGGLGLMIDQPAVRVTVWRHARWQATGPLAERAEAFARKVIGDSEPGLRLVADGPAEHVGLGVGTALGLSVAAACRRLMGARIDSVHELAALVDRGERSGVGICGFERGGFIVDGGRAGDAPPQLREWLEFPAEWRVVLVRPFEAGRWHGNHEQAAFRRARTAEEALATSHALESLADEVATAVREKSFTRFASGLGEFNLKAGEPFRVDQGGSYAGPVVTAVVRRLREWGYAGVGQSSWGPTVFAFTPDEDEADSLAGRARADCPADTEVRVVRANNRGADLTEGDTDQPDEQHVGRQNEE